MRHLEDNIWLWCELFVFINHARVYLIHQTVKEFLVRESGGAVLSHHQWKHCLDAASIEANVANICTNLLLLKDVGSANSPSIEWHGNGRFRSFEATGYVGNFLAYAAENWPTHLRKTRFTNGDPIRRRYATLFRYLNHTFIRIVLRSDACWSLNRFSVSSNCRCLWLDLSSEL